MENIKKSRKNNIKIIFSAILIVFFMIFSSFILTSCGEKTIPVERVSLSITETSLYKNQIKKVYVTTYPEEANNYNLEWSSTNKEIASVDKKGFIKAVNYGDVVITCKVKGTDIKAECKVTVNDGEICSLKIEENFKIYYEGQVFNKESLNVYAVYESGKKVFLQKNEYTIEAPDTLKEDSKIKITYGHFSSNYSPTIIQDYVTGIDITSSPNKISYAIGEKFDKAGLQVSLTYASGKKEITQDYVLDTDTIKYKQKEVKVIYKKFTDSISITSHAAITVNSIAKLQEAINQGYTSIMITEGKYNTTTQIELNSSQDIFIFGENQETSIIGYDIIPIKITGKCDNITIADIKLSTNGDNAATHQLDLSYCESGNITLQNVSFLSILQSENEGYILKVIN